MTAGSANACKGQECKCVQTSAKEAKGQEHKCVQRAGVQRRPVKPVGWDEKPG
jgi:hypothetical protein